MLNLKHTASAMAAVVMIGSLATNQATYVEPVKAQRITPVEIQFKQPEILKGDGEGIVVDSLLSFELKKEEKAYITVNEGNCELKAEPSWESETVAYAECADEMTILEETDEWCKVQNGDVVAYVHKDNVTKSYEEARNVLLAYFKYETGFVNADGVNIRNSADSASSYVIDQADEGDGIVVLERVSDDWFRVFYGKDYDIGYINSAFVTINGLEDKTTVVDLKIKRINEIVKKGVISSQDNVTANVMPDENSEVVATLSNDSAIRIVKKGTKWTKIAIGENGNTAYVKSEYVLDEAQIAAREEAKARAAAQASRPEKAVSKTVAKSSATEQEKKPVTTKKATSTSGQAIVNEAEKYLGTKYVYGGNSPSTGFDCSGLVQYVCKNVGISVNRSSKAQYSDGYSVSKSDLQPGDLVFFSKGGGISHVVIYAGDGKVIHSPRPGKSVCYTTLSNICSYSNYVGARRVA